MLLVLLDEAVLVGSTGRLVWLGAFRDARLLDDGAEEFRAERRLGDDYGARGPRLVRAPRPTPPELGRQE